MCVCVGGGGGGCLVVSEDSINSNNTQPVLFETSASVKLYYGIFTRCTNANQQTGTLRHNHPKLIQ